MADAPSYTVENYLKAIYKAQAGQREQRGVVPMGQLASALGVVPGTATTMVKALAESGLVEYEPYVGVRLSSAGQKLAALVLRRHRLIELFLVQVMGMSWTEVHDEAEHLEHAVSDRLIDRIDEMLGRPKVDPHGDPIPTEEGHLTAPHYDNLLTCPLHVPVRVTRVADQDADFLRFIEKSHLKPGEIVQIEDRDAAADRVTLKRRDDVIAIGTRAAAKLMVQTALLLLLFGGSARAQQPPAAPPSNPDRPFEIQDNSFLVEEAFNQEAGIFQNIFNFIRGEGAWEFAFTQEWPVGSQTHQLSYTVPFVGAEGADSGVGDALLNYRYQLWTESDGWPAFSPRVSLVLPTAGRERGLDTLGYQVNLPFSKQLDDFYVHWNAGFTSFPGVEFEAIDETTGEPIEETLFRPHVSGSVIWRARPMVHPMLEAVFRSEDFPGGRTSLLTLSPGIRLGRNYGDHQLVVGGALPVTFYDGGSDAALLLYLSYELPFRR